LAWNIVIFGCQRGGANKKSLQKHLTLAKTDPILLECLLSNVYLIKGIVPGNATNATNDSTPPGAGQVVETTVQLEVLYLQCL
jgi:hypothetical protein